jgi:hypothetical protein
VRLFDVIWTLAQTCLTRVVCVFKLGGLLDVVPMLLSDCVTSVLAALECSVVVIASSL